MSKIQYTVFRKCYTLCMMGDRPEDVSRGEADEFGTFDTLEAAIAEARELAEEDGGAKLVDQRGAGIGAIEHAVYYVDAFVYDEESDEWLPCDENGEQDEWGGAHSVYYHCALDDSPELKAAWDKAVRAKWDFLDYKADEFYTVRAFLEEGGDEK